MKKNKGITLIALMISVIIMLILAGISINALFGDDGIIQKAREAKELTAISNVLFTLESALVEYNTEPENLGRRTLTIESILYLCDQGYISPENSDITEYTGASSLSNLTLSYNVLIDDTYDFILTYDGSLYLDNYKRGQIGNFSLYTNEIIREDGSTIKIHDGDITDITQSIYENYGLTLGEDGNYHYDDDDYYYDYEYDDDDDYYYDYEYDDDDDYYGYYYNYYDDYYYYCYGNDYDDEFEYIDDYDYIELRERRHRILWKKSNILARS